MTSPDSLPAVRIFARLLTAQALMVLYVVSFFFAIVLLYQQKSVSSTLVSVTGKFQAQAVLGTLQSTDALQTDRVLQIPGPDEKTPIRIQYITRQSLAQPQVLADEFEKRAVELLRRGTTTPITETASQADHWIFHYAAMLPNGGVVLMRLPLASARQGLDTFFAKRFLLTGVALSAYIVAIFWLFNGLRRDLKKMSTSPEEHRQKSLRFALSDSRLPKRRNWLPFTVATVLMVFALELNLPNVALAGAGYVTAVMWSLWSSRPWHTYATAAAAMTCSFTAPMLSAPEGDIWTSLTAHVVSTYFVIATSIFGIAHLRRTRAEAAAVNQAQQAKEETEELRSALQRAEAAEAESAKILDRLRLATHSAGISVWEWDLVQDRIIPMENSDLGTRMGNEDSRSGGFIRTLVVDEDRKEFYDKFKKYITAPPGGDDLLAHRYRTRRRQDSALRHIQFYAKVLRNAEGRAVRILGVNWDITGEVEATQELERQAEHLRDAERRLERASLSSLEGHFEADLHTEKMWISTSFKALIGDRSGTTEPVWHNLLEDWVHPDDRNRHAAAFQAHLNRGVPYETQIRIRVLDGNYRWCAIQGAADHDAQGKAARLAGSIRDINAQKLAEISLHEVQARFQRAIRGTQDALFEIDIQANTFWASPRMWAMFGYDLADAPQRSTGLRHLIHPEDLPTVDAAFKAHCDHNTPYDVEYRSLLKKGGFTWVRCRATAERDADGKAIRFAGAVQDITEARAAREALMQATEAAEAASKAKSTFLATMSHEIRTPMNGIIGMTGLLLDTELDRPQREYADTIRSSADSLLTVINDILDFSKIEAGKLDIESIEMDLRGCVEDVGAMMALQATAKNLELIVDIRNDVPSHVMGDPQRIRQCLVNLVGNALKFTSKGEIVVELCTVASQEGKSLVHFQVRDTGIGLTEQARIALFQPFVQADASTTRRFGGTGLGLSIVKRLIETMGGQVGVESEVGKGSTFWFVLPLQAIEPTARNVRIATLGAGQRILVVDDNQTNLRVLTAQLERVGFHAQGVDSATQALQHMHDAAKQGHPFDVVLLDYQMPDLDGAALGERINADMQLSHSRLVLLTSVDKQGHQKQFSELGFAAYLTKPVRARELYDCLERVLALEAREWHMHSQPMVTRGVLSKTAGSTRYSGLVLLAEDNVVNQKVAQKFVERLGCSVQIAPNGAEAVAAFRQGHFDLILMDMEMPVMDGLQAAREIRALEAGAAHIPIIALTANVLTDQVAKCLEAGMDDFLAKPLEAQRLRDVFDRFLPKASSEPERKAN